MTDISHSLKPKPDRPFDPLTLLVISEIQQAADRLGLQVFVVGAVARIIDPANASATDHLTKSFRKPSVVRLECESAVDSPVQ